MKTIDGSKIRFFLVIFIAFIMYVCCYVYEYNLTYNSIRVVVSEKKKVEYGTQKYDIKNIIEEIDGEFVSVVKDVDTSIIGPQEVIVEVRKDNIIREIPFIVEVVDTVAPEIKIKEENVTIKQGEDYDIFSNIESVHDCVDGDLIYQEKILVEDTDINYYTVDGDVDVNTPGEYSIIVKAVDKASNVTEVSFKVKVEEVVVFQRTESLYTNLPANASANGLVATAYSLVGSPYVAGGNTPAGFDCSGFVQYVYAQNGISVSRSSSTQIYDGVAVSYDSAQPGDILSWGYAGGGPTHSALYIGNGQMIHATNPSQGVIVSDVAAWTRGSGTQVIGVRRIQ